MSARDLIEAIQGLGFQPAGDSRASMLDDDDFERRIDPAEYDDRAGYSHEFLDHSVPFPVPQNHLANDVLLIEGSPLSNKNALTYTNFSVQLSSSRRLPIITAVNVDGAQLEDLRREKNAWRNDPRVVADAQVGSWFYKQGEFDRGHMVRRLDPVWGASATLANDDTFHYTNACPQHPGLNQRTWRLLEECIYDHLRNNELRGTILTGPALSISDPMRNDLQIPVEYWKVLVVPDKAGRCRSYGYMLSQSDLVRGLERTLEDAQTYQLPIEELERLCNLSFGPLSDIDDRRDSGFLESVGDRYVVIEETNDMAFLR